MRHSSQGFESRRACGKYRKQGSCNYSWREKMLICAFKCKTLQFSYSILTSNGTMVSYTVSMVFLLLIFLALRNFFFFPAQVCHVEICVTWEVKLKWSEHRELKSNNYSRLFKSEHQSLYVISIYFACTSAMRNLTILLILLIDTNHIFNRVTTREKVTERWKADF